MTVIQRFIKYLEELLWHFRDLICSGIVLPSVICISAKWEHQERKLLQLISQQFNISLWQKWKTFKFSIDCCSDSYNNVHSLKHHQLLFFFSSFKHIQMMNKSQLTHGNVSIDPTGTFTPDSLFTVRKKKATMTKLTDQSRAQSDILLFRSPSLVYSPISSVQCLVALTQRPTDGQEAKKYWTFVTDLPVSQICPCFLFFLYWHNIQKWPFPRLPPPSLYFSPTCLQWGLITRWTG